MEHYAAEHNYACLLQQLEDAVEGRRPSFSGEHMRLPARFEGSERAAIADYLPRLAGSRGMKGPCIRRLVPEPRRTGLSPAMMNRPTRAARGRLIGRMTARHLPRVSDRIC